MFFLMEQSAVHEKTITVTYKPKTAELYFILVECKNIWRTINMIYSL